MTRRLATLVELVREIGHAGEAQQIYESALTALSTIAGVDRSSILLLDSEGVSRFRAWRGLSDSYRVAVEGHFPWSLDDPDPKPLLFEDVEQEPSLAPLIPLLRVERIRAVSFIPLIYRERLVGKFMLYFDQPHVLAQDEFDLANAVAYLVAFAVERRRLYAELEESDRRKDVFLATLSHELRNPLAATSASLALVELHRDASPSIAMAHDVLARSLGQIVKLVDDLLDISRLSHGVITLEKHPVDLSSLVHHAVASLDTSVVAHEQELTLALEPLWIDADPVRVEQVIANLVGNAVKYTPKHGHIRISTNAKDGGVEIHVRDDGIGISADVIPHLFELFVQVDSSLTRTQGGLGIGLSIVRELVGLHGGTVTVASEGRGRGSEFTVWLPGRIDERPAISPLPEAAKPHGQRRRILVVDDNEDAATMLAMLLEAWGHEVTTAPDGPTALAAVADQHPEIVLLDLGLPGMSGYDVAARLRASGETELRIVAVSGYGRPEDVARARAAGFDTHLTKPVDRRGLERVLADVGA